MTQDENGLPELPQGWTWTTLGEVRLDESKSITPQKSPDQMFELYSVPSFNEGKPEIVSGDQIGSSKRRVESDTVLLCKINPRINRVWVVGSHSPWPKIASTEWIPFFRLDEIDPKYLCYFMQTSKFRSFLALNVSGVGGSLMRVKANTLAEYPFPLAPLTEQHRIVAKIEELFTQLDAGVAALEKAQVQLRRYRQAVLKAAVEGKLTREWRESHRGEVEPALALLERILEERRGRWEAENPGKRYKPPAWPDIEDLPALPDGWVWATWDQMSPRVTVGHVGKMKDEYIESGIPFLRSQNVRENRFDPTGLVYVSPEFHAKLAKSALKPGDMVVVRSGSVGVTCTIPESLEEANCSDLVIIQKSPGIVSEYGSYYMNSVAKRYVRAGQVGIALTHFNTKSVAALPVAVPPLAEQQRIVSEVEQHLSAIDEMERTVEQSRKRAARLRQSILKRAFEGRLVPQDAADEPAAALLARIREERGRGGKRKAKQPQQLELFE